MTDPAPERHAVTRIRREPQRRSITVAERIQLSPSMLRLRFEGSELAGFDSAGADDHIKLFIPGGERGEGGRPEMRDYTPRSFDGSSTLVIDFALHEAGPATLWAMNAKVGDSIQIGGPRGSTVIADDYDWYWLIGDETALPAIGRRCEELRADVPVTVVAVVDGEADRIAIEGRARIETIWVYRDGGETADEALIQAALASHALPQGDGYVWIAAETQVARALRHHMIEERGHPKSWTKAAGYWTRGEADSHARIED